MTPSISVQEKKEFIKWFLSNHSLKRQECVWILNYIISHEETLENIHFVEQAHFCERAIVMSTQGTGGVPLRFYYANLMTDNAEKVFHSLGTFPDKPLYIQLNFYEKNQSPEYVSVLEENPNVPTHLKKPSPEDEQLAVEFLEVMSKEFQRNEYMKQIDAALDRGDKRTFMELSEMLRIVNVSKQSMEVSVNETIQTRYSIYP